MSRRAELRILVSSTRPTRIGARIAQWVATQVPPDDWNCEFLDLAELDLPLLDEEDVPHNGNYRLPHTLRWASLVQEADAMVIVTPEYNGSFTAPLKNAIDMLHAEWRDKPIGLVGYGWGGLGGQKATTALGLVLENIKADQRGVVNLKFGRDLQPDGAVTNGCKAAEVAQLLRSLQPAA